MGTHTFSLSLFYHYGSLCVKQTYPVLSLHECDVCAKLEPSQRTSIML